LQIQGDQGYFAVDSDNNLSEPVKVDGRNSHTHAEDQTVVKYEWFEGTTLVGTGVSPSLVLGIGTHNIDLRIEDSAGNTAIDSTIATVYEKGYPILSAISPVSGMVNADTLVTLTGTGFSQTTMIKFGVAEVLAGDFTVVSDTILTLTTPLLGVAVPVDVSVVTPKGESNTVGFQFVGEVPIDFTAGTKLLDFAKPCSIAFGPDGKLYLGNSDGKIAKLTLSEDFTQVVSTVISQVQPSNRNILGIAFDPLDTSANPSVYCTSAEFYHKEWRDTTAKAINGKVSQISGANLDVVVDIVTGLPISEADHGVSSFFCFLFLEISIAEKQID
jgi:IPT/TIG domain